MRIFMHASHNGDNDKSADCCYLELEAIKPPQNLVRLLEGQGLLQGHPLQPFARSPLPRAFLAFVE